MFKTKKTQPFLDCVLIQPLKVYEKLHGASASDQIKQNGNNCNDYQDVN